MATPAFGVWHKRAPGERASAGLRISAILLGQASQAVLFVPVALGLGIWLWFVLPWVAQRQAALVAAAAVAMAGLALKGPARSAVVGGALLVAAGLLLAEWRSVRVAAPRLHHVVPPALQEGKVEDVRREAGGLAIVLRRDDGVRLGLKVPEASASLRPGDRIRVRAALLPSAPPPLPFGFDPARRDWFLGISARGRVLGPVTVVARSPPDLAQGLGRMRLLIEERLVARLGPERGAIAAALVTGARALIPPELAEAFRLAGLAHLVTVSGFHIGALAAAVLLVARRLPLLLAPRAFAARSPRAPAALAAMGAAWAYVLLSGAEVPAVRAGITASLVLLALALGRDPFSLRLLAAAATVILALRPESLLSPGFQMSFAAVTALLLLADWPPFRRLALAQGSLPARLAARAGALVVSSLVAEAVLTPIAIAHFGRAGLYGVLANTLAIPLAGLVLIPLLAVLLLAAPVGLDGVVASLVGPPLGALAAIARWVAGLPGAGLAVPLGPPAAHALAAGGALLLALLAGPLRLVGLPLVAAALGLHLAHRRPDILVSPDAAQVGVVEADGTLFLARGRGESRLARAWAEGMGAERTRPLARHPGARCWAEACWVALGPGFRLLVVRSNRPLDPSRLARWCAAADLAVGPRLDPWHCRPRWHRLDRAALVPLGAVAVNLGPPTLVTGPAGDHPWSPAALPGRQRLLLGGERWIAPLAE